MTTYNTGNALGSSNVKDLFDNAQNLDELMNDKSSTFKKDRFGVPRRTWHGVEKAVDEFLINSGYEHKGDYKQGLVLTERNQVFHYSGNLYRLNGSASIPFTATNWQSDHSKFTVIGDSSLRQDLGSGNKGAEIVRFSPSETVKEAIQDLKDKQTTGHAIAKLGGRAMSGLPVRIAIYGDSTTDGTATSGWTGNAVDGSGRAKGNHNHNPESPNSWPVVLQSLLREISGNENINVYNAGYGGKAAITGWFLDNYDTAIHNNPHYRDATHVVIATGLNDVVQNNFNYDNFLNALLNLIKKVKESGRTPVIVTPDVPFNNIARNVTKVLGVATNAIREAANLTGIELVDTGAWLVRWQNMREDNDRWAYHQFDGLHFSNIGHAQKASYFAKEMLKGFIVDVSDGLRVAPWQGQVNNNGASVSVINSINNYFSACLAITPKTTNFNALTLYLWSDKTMYQTYASVDRDIGKLSTFTTSNTINVKRLISNSQTSYPIFFGNHSSSTDSRGSELALQAGVLQAGISKVEYNCALANKQSLIGYFYYKSSKEANFERAFVQGGVGAAISDDLNSLNRNSMSSIGSPVKVLKISGVHNDTGVIISCGRVFDDEQDVTLKNRSCGLIVAKRGGNIELMSFTAENTRTLNTTTIATSSSGEHNHESELIVATGLNSTGNQVIQILANNKHILNYEHPLSEPPLIINGVIGGSIKLSSNGASYTSVKVNTYN